eukprot:TRINITY_DN27776_c0_g1_i1.p1 TRINITY_DN27776_c0_g1~~TRINITY_DN27776_c0_g1_i1.p1  ORF type:complete len:658 (+),score=321.83 TRINITY_DN27776_c0_g1_i1:73-1974(+)
MAPPAAGAAAKEAAKENYLAMRSEVKEKEKEVKKGLKAAMKKYKKGNEEGMQARYVTEADQPARLKRSLRKAKDMKEEAARAAARAEMIHHTEEAGFIELEDGEEGRDITQRDLSAGLDIQTKRKQFDLALDRLGPYRHDYSVNGNMLALCGEKGHLSIFEWKKFRLFGEVQLRDKVYDVKFFNDDQLLATAQKKYVYIYNNKGHEVHLLKNLQNITTLDFLPKHMLLTGIGQQGVLHYFDVSIGSHVSVQKTKMGPCNVARQNPWNGVMALGHTLGTVSMWSPKCTAPLVKMLTHSAPLVDLTFSKDGRYMVTAAADSQVKVWDTRTWKRLHNIKQQSAPLSLDVSQTGLLAVSSFHKAEIWKDWDKGSGNAPLKPYLAHKNRNNADVISRLRFCPYEDVLGSAHAGGFSNLIVPGSGEANYDYFVANPYESQKQRMERPVHQLLEKLPPEMITLNPRQIGQVNDRKVKEKRQIKKLHEQQQAYLRKKEEEGVQEDDAASDDIENTIIRPEVEPMKESAKDKIRRPKHLKEKRLYLQKQEHQRFQAKKAAKRKREETLEGRQQDGAGADDAAPDTAGDVRDPAGGAGFEPTHNEPGSQKKKRRKTAEPRKNMDALDMFFKRQRDDERERKRK